MGTSLEHPDNGHIAINIYIIEY